MINHVRDNTAHIDLADDDQAIANTHTDVATPEEHTGFADGGRVIVIGKDTWVTVGSTSAIALAGGIYKGPQDTLVVKLKKGETGLFVNAASGGKYAIYPMRY